MVNATETSDVGAVASEHVLTVENVRTTFETSAGVVRAVDGVSFELDLRQTVGIVGESGSGKTMLGRTIMKLLPSAASVSTSSVIRFRGEDISKWKPHRLEQIRGSAMSMVFQDPMTSLNPVLKVGRQLTEHMRIHLPMNRNETRGAALDLLNSVGIPDAVRRYDLYPHQLSGGMRQRVVIAIALACSPMLIIADEPTTALDVTVQAQILDLLQAQQRERGMATILITHDLGVAATRTDTIMVMYAGRIVEKAPTKVLFRNIRHPYTEGLLGCIPRLDKPADMRLRPIPGSPPNLTVWRPGCSFAPRCRNSQPECLESKPALVRAEDPLHEVACFFPVGTPEGVAARERNLSAGVNAAGTVFATGGDGEVL